MNNDPHILVFEMFVFTQMSCDLMSEFANLDIVKSKFRYETNMVNSMFNKQRKRLKRLVPADVLEEFEGRVCNIVDESEDDLALVRADLRREMINKISWDMIEPAILLGMIGGFCDVVMQIKKYLNGKDDSDFKDIYRYLKVIDTKIGFKPMNEGVTPDYEKCKASMIALYKSIGERVSAHINNEVNQNN